MSVSTTDAISESTVPSREPYIRLARATELDDISALACRSFLHDPLFNYYGSCTQVRMFILCLFLVFDISHLDVGPYRNLQSRWSKATNFSEVSRQNMHANWGPDYRYCHTIYQ